MKAVLVAINAKYIHSNLAVYSLWKNAGVNREHIDLCQYTINNQMDAVVRDIYERRPQVLFFSCYVWNIEYVKDIARELFKLLPDVDIWLGGPEVSFEGREFLENNNYFKGIMIGEGEVTFSALLDFYCEKNCSLAEIAGLMYREGVEVVATSCRQLCDLNDVEFVYDDLSEFENKIIYYESSRGCPFRCSYCMSSVDKTVRFRALEKVKKELMFFLDNKVPQVKFIDRTFNIDVRRTMEILRFLADNDNGVTNFHFEVAADIITDEEIELLKELRPGYVQLEIGVQSTNPATIMEIDRKMDFSKVAEVAAKLIAADNMHIHLDLIAGLPKEDLASFKNSFNEVYALQPHELQLGFLKVLKGSKMHEKAAEYGIVYGDKAPYEVLMTKWLTFDDIICLKEVEEMLEVYYNSGLFVNSLKVILERFESPFDMYRGLADYYKKNDLLELNHTRMTRYRILREFAGKQGVCPDVFDKVLLFDLYSRENLKTRPDFAPDNSELRAQIKELTREIGTQSQKKNFHIEPFDIDILKLVESGELVRENVMVLFDYSDKHPVRNMARARKL